MHGLLTDRSELAMLGLCLREAVAERRSVFELSVPRLPPARRFLVAAGLDRVVRQLSTLSFTDAQVEYLRATPGLAPVMTDALVTFLREFRFAGDLDAVPEGEVIFGDEPILRVRGSYAEAQVIGAFLLGAMQAETRVASKAARLVLAAGGRPVLESAAVFVDPTVAPWVARAAWLGGCAATSCDEAGARYGVPVSGALGRTLVLTQVDRGEEAVFRAYAGGMGPGSSLRVETFDALRGALRAARGGPSVTSVRIESGDLAGLSRAVRAVLDQAGRSDVQIVAGGALDEHGVRALLDGGAPVDGFEVGAALAMTPDAPSLGAVYEPVETTDDRGERVAVGGRPPGAAGAVGARQVLRRSGEDGRLLGDLVVGVDAPIEETDGAPLLVPVLRKGKFVRELREASAEAMAARARCVRAQASLPEALRGVSEATGEGEYPVRHAERSLVAGLRAR